MKKIFCLTLAALALAIGSLGTLAAQNIVPAERNLKAGQAFLEKNAVKPGITVTPSGLQYKVVAPGSGASPTPEDIVTIHYTIRHVTYDVIDSSQERGKPMESPLTDLVKGVQEGLQLMKTGAIYTLYFPAELGYGEQGFSGTIGPNEALIFEVQLVSFKKAPVEKAGKRSSKK